MIQLGDNEQRFRSLVEGVRDYAILMLDVDGNIASWNAGAEQLKGWSAEEIIGRHFSCFYPAADVAAGKPARELELAERDGTLEDEGWRVRRNGTLFWANVVITAMRYDDGTLRGYSKVTRDMTERREQQAALAASEERYRTVIDRLHEGVVLQNADLEIVTSNAAAERILGLTTDQLLGRRSLDLSWCAVREDGSTIPGEERPAAVAMRTGEPQLDQIIGVRKPDGTLAWINASAQPLYHPGDVMPYAVVASFADITAERNRQANRDRDRAALADAQRIASVGSWSWSPGDDRAEWSREMYRIFGRDPADGPATSDDFFAYLHCDDRDRIAAGYARAFGAGARFELDYRIQAGDGEVRDLHGIGYRDDTGCYVGTVQDITERKRIEAALRDAEHLLALAFENSPLGMTLSTPDRRVVKMNRAFADMLGYTVPEMLAEQRPTRFTHPDDVAGDVKQLSALHAGDLDSARWEKRYLHADGHSVWAHLSVAVLRDGAGAPTHFVSQIEDISERRQRDTEEQALRRVAELVAQGAGSAAVFDAISEQIREAFDLRLVSRPGEMCTGSAG